MLSPFAADFTSLNQSKISRLFWEIKKIKNKPINDREDSVGVQNIGFRILTLVWHWQRVNEICSHWNFGILKWLFSQFEVKPKISMSLNWMIKGFIFFCKGRWSLQFEIEHSVWTVLERLTRRYNLETRFLTWGSILTILQHFNWN